jgi:hypothetical protein
MALTPEEARSIDCAIAEKVMGWNRQHDVWSSPEFKTSKRFDLPPPYSTNIASVWEVVEKLRTTVDGVYIQTETKGWQVEIHETCEWFTAWSDQLPEAICLAALKAVGHEFKEPV